MQTFVIVDIEKSKSTVLLSPVKIMIIVDLIISER